MNPSLNKVLDLLIKAGYDAKLSGDGQSLLVDYDEGLGYEVVDAEDLINRFGWGIK